jgi:hypothetical protein
VELKNIHHRWCPEHTDAQHTNTHAQVTFSVLGQEAEEMSFTPSGGKKGLSVPNMMRSAPT